MGPAPRTRRHVRQGRCRRTNYDYEGDVEDRYDIPDYEDHHEDYEDRYDVQDYEDHYEDHEDRYSIFGWCDYEDHHEDYSRYIDDSIGYESECHASDGVDEYYVDEGAVEARLIKKLALIKKAVEARLN